MSKILKKVLFFTLVLMFFMSGINSVHASSVNNFNGLFTGTKEALKAETKLSTYIDDYPLLTVLIPGQGGKNFHWSNNGDQNLSYDSESLIERLRVSGGFINVYQAVGYTIGGVNSFKLRNILINNDSYVLGENIVQFNDIQSHIVVVFESSENAGGSHELIYNEWTV